MGNRTSNILVCTVAAAALALGACASKTTVESDLGLKGAPDWVNKGTNILNDKDGRLFHGVGSASPMPDMALQQATADDRARAEVARIFSSYMDVVSNDYQAATRSDGGPAASEEAVSRQIKNVSQLNLAGAKVIGRWRDKKTNIIYSIAELDLKHVKNTMAGSREMNEDVKRFVAKNADNIFDRMSQEKR
ncbi:MAG: hypothetical protein JSW09_03695 [Pseudomonadota bacterium]|nr:MAG: hypothetical protein JSW09_03695 [Pseudomonadota bacterium]